MKRNRITLFTSVLLLISVGASAQLFDKYSNDFMNIGVGARGLAMSGAQVASVNDVTAGYYNPAGLMNINGDFTASLMHAEYFAGIAKYDYGALSFPINDGEKRLGFTLLRFGVDDIPNTLFLLNPDGSINYNNITSFSVANYAFITSFASKVDAVDGLSWGGNVKVIYNQVGSFATSWGVGLDAGVQYYTDTWRFGAMGKDITTTYNDWTFNFNSAEQQVLLSTGNVVPSTSTELTAPSLILGGAYYYEISDDFSVLPEIDATITSDGEENALISAKPFSIQPMIGAEGCYGKIIYLRAGVGNFQRATSDVTGNRIYTVQPNIGVGVKIKSVSIDYALTNLGALSESLYSNVISVKIELNQEDR